MNLETTFLILKKQFTQKWGRFLLASGGIMIGIWAISLTTALSLSVSDAVVTSINSQPFAKSINISKLEGGETDFQDVSAPPVFEILPISEIQDLAQEDDRVTGFVSRGDWGFYFNTSNNQEYQCISSASELEQSLAAQGFFTSLNFSGLDEIIADIPDSEIKTQVSEFAQNCKPISFNNSVFQNFYDNNTNNWYGSTSEPKVGEASLCYDCGIGFGETMGFENPEDMLNQSIWIEPNDVLELYQAGTTVDADNFTTPDTFLETTELIELKVVSIVDDSEEDSFFANFGTQIYIPQETFYPVLDQKYENFTPNTYGSLDYGIYVNDFANMEDVDKDLKDKGYLPFSLGLALVLSITVAFNVLTVVLSGFGFIALIASVFGIINVMTISVLERKKEIGILKSLGARDGDIFRIFFFESFMLGFIGWFLGIMLTSLINLIISLSFNTVTDSLGWAENLKELNLENFSPSLPVWLYFGTLAIALFFTGVSGVWPAYRASKENPVEVLRGE